MPAHLTLPILNEEELVALFSDDRDGLRRYRLLHGLLVQNMTQREAARLNAVSERTVRNILRAYAQSGRLESLRSRAPAARRRRKGRADLAAQALAEALG